MKTKYLLPLLMIGLPGIAQAFADWVTSAIDEQISVQAPVPLVAVDMSKVMAATPDASKEDLAKLSNTKLLAARDASGVYMVLRIGSDIPGADFRQQRDRTEFFTGYISSMVERDQGYLLERAPFTINGMEGVDFKYKGLHQFTKKMVVKYGRVLFVDKLCYSVSFIPANLQDSTGTSGSQERIRFFQSIAVKPAALPKK